MGGSGYLDRGIRLPSDAEEEEAMRPTRTRWMRWNDNINYVILAAILAFIVRKAVFP